MNKTYKIANYNKNSDGKLVKAFKNSIFGMDIGVKSENFLATITLATILAVGTMISMYYFWRI